MSQCYPRAFTLVAGVIWPVLAVAKSVWIWPALFFCLDNLLTFTLQAFVPLGFNDGSTLLHWLRRHSG